MAITGIDTIDGKQIIAAGASSAVKAAQDGNGNNIASTYQTTAGMSNYQTTADMGDYATTADLTGKQDTLTFNYNESDLITGINSSGIATGGGSTYSAGTGIDITDDVISVNSEYVPYLTITNNKNTSQVTYGDLQALCNGTKMFNLRYGNLIYYVARATSVASHCELIFSTPNTNTEYENYNEDLVYTKIKYYITIYFFPDDVTDSTVAYINGNNIKRVQLNIQPNWNETNTLSETYIQNKPSIPTVQLNDDNEVSAINNYPLAGGGSFPASADEACQVVTANSANWNEVSAKVDISATIPIVSSFSKFVTATDYIGAVADTSGNLYQIVSRTGDPQSAWVVEYTKDAITRNVYWENWSNNWPISSRWTISPHYMVLADDFSISPGWLKASGVITANTGGFTANGVAANTTAIIANDLTATTGGFTANGVTAGTTTPFVIQGLGESLSESYGNGFIFSSVNSGIGTARLTVANPNAFIQMYSPKFEAKNISGAGFSIEGSGAKGYDEHGNVVWDTTKPAKLIGWSNYQGTAIDQRAAGINGGIIATVYPDQIPVSMTISSAPYSYMNGYGFFAINPSNGTTLSVDTTYSKISLLHTGMSATAAMDPGDIYYRKYNNDTSATDVWSLTGSVQKRELEGDSAVSSISAIAGSALTCELPADLVYTATLSATSALLNDDIQTVSAAIPVLSSLNTEGITDIQLVNELPVDPVSTVLYLIPEA